MNYKRKFKPIDEVRLAINDLNKKPFTTLDIAKEVDTPAVASILCRLATHGEIRRLGRIAVMGGHTLRWEEIQLKPPRPEPSAKSKKGYEAVYKLSIGEKRLNEAAIRLHEVLNGFTRRRLHDNR